MPETIAAFRSSLTLVERLKGLMLFRVLLVTSLFGSAILINANTLADLSNVRNAALEALIVLTYGLTIVYALVLRMDRGLERLAWAQVALDLVLSGTLVAVTGGLRGSVFLPTLYLPILSAAFVLGRQASLTCAVGVSLFLGSLTLMELGVLPSPSEHKELLTTSQLRATMIQAGSNVLLAFVLSVLTGRLATQLGQARVELQRRQEDIAELQALHDNILVSIHSGLLTVDLQRHIIFCNAAAARLTEVQEHEVLGRPLGEIFPELAEELQGLEPQQEGVEHRAERQFTTAGGRELSLGFEVSVLRSADREPRGWIVIFQDLTAIKALEAQAERSERLAAIGQLAASIAHEIRNPLASISGSVEMLQMFATLEPDEQELVEIILRETERLNQLIGDFLNFSRPRELRMDDVDMRRLIEDLLKLFQHRAGQVAVSLTIQPEDGAWIVRVDREALKQALWNLLNNAVEACSPREPLELIEPSLHTQELIMSEELRQSLSDGLELDDAPTPRIDVSLLVQEYGDRRFVVIAVEDDGPGIPQALHERIFEPFFTTKARGTGLGLAIIFRLIEDHGGLLSLEQPKHLGGARFEIRLPSPQTTSTADD